ncbi:MAG: DUF456 domain-containing protein [Xanthomonadales bacterium]|nr:DUF456 domain-containing protein [Xanthomonadales bacterium]
MSVPILLIVLGAVLMLIGLAGVVLPALPGIPLLYAGILLVAWGDGFAHLGATSLIVLGVLTVMALLADLVASLLGAKRVGASKLALVGAALGTVVGLFFGLFGILLGPFVGAFVGEYWNGRQTGDAARVGLGTWLGMVVGAVVKIAIAFLMLGIFALAFMF